MKPYRKDIDLGAELRALRPTPRPSFAAELDARVGAGFPPKEGVGGGALARLRARLRGAPRWRLPALAGAVATAAIVIATAVVAISEEPDATPTAQRFASSPDAGQRSVPPLPKLQRFASPLRPAAGRLAQGRGDSSSFSPQSREASSAAADAYNSAAPSRASGPNAFRAARRDVERSARLVLATEPVEVRAAAARVFETVHDFDAIVLRSSISAGGEAPAGAIFELLVPSGKLGDALAAFSGIAEVRSRHDSTADVTGQTTSLEERLRDSRATIERVLGQIAGADTEAERTAVERELRFQRRRAAVLRSGLQTLERRVNLSRVSLRIESGPTGAAADAGRWGIAEAIDDAGRILAIAAGVTVIGIAILGPLALICLLAWLAYRGWVRQSRKRALS